MRCCTWSWETGRSKVMSITDPLVKSMPGRKPEPPVTQPSGGRAREMMPGIRSRAENRKYQPRFATMSYICLSSSLGYCLGNDDDLQMSVTPA